MQPPNVSRQYGLCCALVVCAHLATEIVLGDQHGQLWLILSKFTAIGLGVGILCWYAVRRNWQPTGMMTLLAIGVMVGPLIIEPLWRILFGVGHPFEIQLLIGFRNLALLNLIWAQTIKYERLAIVTSLFAMLFCISTSNDPSLIWICGLFMVLGICWLCVKYWSELRTDCVRGEKRATPWPLFGIVAVLLLGALLTISMPATVRTRMVEGYMPSSGGTGRADAYARSGVGDGDGLVAATKEALSFAPLEEAPFIEGEEPSLYDVFQDTYGKPKIPKKYDRALSLPPELFNKNHHRMAKAKKSSRTFSIDRQAPQPKKHRHLQDTASNAMLHLVGPVPCHLREKTYDLFDGTEWIPEEDRPNHERKLSVTPVNHKPWITWSTRPSQFAATSDEHHALRVLNVKTNRVLSPVNLKGVHIDLCDRADLFGWAQEDILTMRRSTLPGMTVIHVVSSLIDPRDLKCSDFNLGYGQESYQVLPVGLGMSKIQKLAEEWTREAETDWEKVLAIRDHLRNEYRLDPSSVPPENCSNSLLWFLTESHSGPDYQFATAATVLCRSVGISCRAVSGLYASPDKFEFATQQTPVHPSDAHWWAEVYVGNQNWVTLEATPGYEQSQRSLGILAKTGVLIVFGGELAIQYWPITLVIFLLTGWGIRERGRIESQLLSWLWDLQFRGSDTSPGRLRTMILTTIRLLDRKLMLSKTPRSVSRTFGSQLAVDPTFPIASSMSEVDRKYLSRAFDWACYSPRNGDSNALETARVHRLCRALMHQTYFRQQHS